MVAVTKHGLSFGLMKFFWWKKTNGPGGADRHKGRSFNIAVWSMDSSGTAEFAGDTLINFERKTRSRHDSLFFDRLVRDFCDFNFMGWNVFAEIFYD